MQCLLMISLLTIIINNSKTFIYIYIYILYVYRDTITKYED